MKELLYIGDILVIISAIILLIFTISNISISPLVFAGWLLISIISRLELIMFRMNKK